MTTGPEGVRAALDEAMEGRADMADIVQAGLFEELDETETGSLTAPSPLSAALPTARKPGRPKGAKNRRTEAVTAWLLQQHRHPLSVLMEAYSMATAVLAERLGLRRELLVEKTTTTTMVEGKQVTVEVEVLREGEHFSNADLIELFKLQLRMAEAVLPYVAQKMPLAVQLESAAQLSINFAGVDLSRGVSDPARGEAPEYSAGDGMSVRLGQVGRAKSDD